MTECRSPIFPRLYTFRMNDNTAFSRIRFGWWVSIIMMTVMLPSCSTGANTATRTPEPIIPTRTPRPDVNQPTATPVPRPTVTPIVETEPNVPTITSAETSALNRIGITGALQDVEPAAALGLRAGQYTFWRVWPDVPDVPGLTTWQNVRFGQVGEAERWPANAEVVEKTLAAHPGSTWLIGNEPDVRWQDNLTAEEYATAYHELYTFIKERDPSARIGAGGISLPTPLRLAYLDKVLKTYRDSYGELMPVDLWSIHLFVLREEADSWGIGIPKGMSETAGQLHEIEDHGDIQLFKNYTVAFRDWMDANGYGDRPLAVTEFGILLPEDYGFPPEFVQEYLVATYDYLLDATGPNGLASDGGHLVQYAFWYILQDDGDYQTGNLYDRGLNILTPLGEAFKQYVADRE